MVTECLRCGTKITTTDQVTGACPLAFACGALKPGEPPIGHTVRVPDYFRMIAEEMKAKGMTVTGRSPTEPEMQNIKPPRKERKDDA